MRKISRKECVILPLVLKKRWYDMIASGVKKEEYRQYKDFWITRIEKWQDARFERPLLEKMKLDVIAFSCGYKKPDMFFVCDRILIKEGAPKYPEWGEPNVRHFVLGLGERIELCD